jgi:hypothetical protein
MAGGVRAGSDGGVPGSRAGVGIVVVAGGKVCAAVGEGAKPAGTELIVIALQVVAAKLIDDSLLA